jgi:hypothetical protein
MRTAEVLDLFGLAPEDQDDYERLLREPGDRAAVIRTRTLLRSRLGTFPDLPPSLDVPGEVWLRAFAAEVPALTAWYRQHEVGMDVVADTLADVGHHVALHRRATGAFGLDAGPWISAHFGGGLFRLGRLQFMLRRRRLREPAPPGHERDPWLLDVHIPATGPMLPGAVSRGFDRATGFFPRHFPQQPVTVAVCHSWLLDPYLSDHLADDANLVAFQEAWTAYGSRDNAPDDPLWFLFHTRDLTKVPALPRKSTLQRVVLERIEAGGTWQRGHGFRELEAV